MHFLIQKDNNMKQSNPTQEQNSPKKQIHKSTNSVKLPYLNPNKPMPLPKPKPHPALPSQRHSQPKQFDLHTNHATLPRYDPAIDKNLLYFFHKPTNRKLLEAVQHLEHPIPKKKHNATDRQRNQSENNYQPNLKRISKLDFDSYLQHMKARVGSENAAD